MQEKPIIFNGEMVRAVLDGRKTQTRRVLKPQPTIDIAGARPEYRSAYGFLRLADGGEYGPIRCPYGQHGDRLWVRETFALHRIWNEQPPSNASDHQGIWWRADNKSRRPLNAFPGRIRPSIHMPRWASRLTLDVIDVRLERVQEISEADALAEGVEFTQRSYGPGWRDYRGAYGAWFVDAKNSFSTLWDSIYAKRGYSWESNPWVWVVEFEGVVE